MEVRQEAESAPKVNQDSQDLQDSKEREDLRVCLDPPAPLAVPSRQCQAPPDPLVSPERGGRKESLVSRASPSLALPDEQERSAPQDSPACPDLRASQPGRTASQESQDAPGCRGRGDTLERQDRRVKRATPASTASEAAPVYQDSPDPQDLPDSQVVPVDLVSREREDTQAPLELSDPLAPRDPRVRPDTPERRETPARP